MKCENCGNDSPARFCTKYCARSFSTKEKRDEINRKVSLALKGKKVTRKKHYSQARREKQRETFRRKREEHLSSTPFDELTKDFKRIVIMREQKSACLSCGLVEWLGKPIPLELEHKDGDNKNNKRDNLCLLCHNCHALTPTWRGRNVKSKRNIAEENLKQALLDSNSIKSALESAGLNGKGNNYIRAKKILKNLLKNPKHAQYIQKNYCNIELDD